MNIIKKFILFLKKILKKDNTIKKISYSNDEKTNKSDFTDSLKIDTTKNRRKNPPIKTMVCSGDGLGIQNKMSS